MTLLNSALEGIITPAMEQVAAQEGVTPEFVRQGIAEGTIVVPHNMLRRNRVPVGIGTGLRTKVSASVGLYGDKSDLAEEVKKIKMAVAAGTDAIMDLSVSGDIDGMRKEALAATPTPVGTLPLYQALVEAREKYGSPVKMKVEELFEVIERQAADGIDFLALHCGTTISVVERAQKEGRVDPLVSYGGSHLIGWMLYNQRENPLYEYYERILEIARRYDVTLSLADGMRPGCLADSLDGPQVQELVVLGELVQRAREAGVQVMVKGPGHVPLNQLKATVALQKSLCQGAPYFVFGPVVTDIAAGYDHINAAIGGALSAWAGADFLCYVTASEHLGLPDSYQVREGVVAARIAAHAADLAKGLPGAREWDLEISRARKELDWKKQIALAIDPERARQLRKERSNDASSGCAMCGKYCAMEIVSQYLGTSRQTC
ncbi:Thiamine biosynthesis protein ThiC [Moorella glycerini]|uniref:Phosphomethylpyrimidine synthase n=1 Tax=Neomoorella stamsii TaxID=1266720 RepID=A0A9X7J2Q5_9FIRM|nr:MULTISPECIES: phosphomethylpyrimidine synthase ThiC [Moorella]PRR72807.1 Phosphomethylpyrimidine synthase [Moorella stamsii]CEP66256.1 Thiamine biosynthesis protein ThiC [Moorella glycerini]CEP68152.1 Thiamine biosynthesis protein ThiC [Moorella glycerini]